jgi:hypothetical protein
MTQDSLIEPNLIIGVAKEHARTVSIQSFIMAASTAVMAAVLITGRSPQSHHWIGAGAFGLFAASLVYAYIYWAEGVSHIDLRSIAGVLDEVEAEPERPLPTVNRRLPGTMYQNVLARMPRQWPDEAVNWAYLAEYVLENNVPSLSRDALVPKMVKHFAYSRRNAGDTYKTFPEVMVEMRLARPTASGYEWDLRSARRVFRLIADELRAAGQGDEEDDDIPLPHPRITMARNGPVTGRVVTAVTDRNQPLPPMES